MPVARHSLMVLCRHLKMTMTRWRKLLETAGDPYRPERHYMRGPGPLLRNLSPSPVHKRLHLFLGKPSIFVAVHCLENSLVSHLKLRQ